MLENYFALEHCSAGLFETLYLTENENHWSYTSDYDTYSQVYFGSIHGLKKQKVPLSPNPLSVSARSFSGAVDD